MEGVCRVHGGYADGCGIIARYMEGEMEQLLGVQRAHGGHTEVEWRALRGHVEGTWRVCRGCVKGYGMVARCMGERGMEHLIRAKGATRGIEWLHRGGNGVTARCMEGAQNGIEWLLGAWRACRGCAEGYGWLQ